MRGKDIDTMSLPELRARIGAYRAVMLDIGTGDGRYVYRCAQARPDWFHIGLDASAENLAEYAVRIARKPARGGLANVLYVIDNIETLPEELHEIADEVHINYPWGSLLRGIILADATIMHNIAHSATATARIEVLINYNVFFDPVPLEILDLPEVTDEYIAGTLAAAYARHGLEITGVDRLGKAEMKDIPTSWSKRLAFGKKPHTVRLYLRAR